METCIHAHGSLEEVTKINYHTVFPFYIRNSNVIVLPF